MKLLSVFLITFMTGSLFALERVANPCWNNSLGEDRREVCDLICTPAVDAILKDKELSPCLEEQKAVENCLDNIDNCPNFDELNIKKDNCGTNLVKACFKNVE